MNYFTDSHLKKIFRDPDIKKYVQIGLEDEEGIQFITLTEALVDLIQDYMLLSRKVRRYTIISNIAYLIGIITIFAIVAIVNADMGLASGLYFGFIYCLMRSYFLKGVSVSCQIFDCIAVGLLCIGTMNCNLNGFIVYGEAFAMVFIYDAICSFIAGVSFYALWVSAAAKEKLATCTKELAEELDYCCSL